MQCGVVVPKLIWALVAVVLCGGVITGCDETSESPEDVVNTFWSDLRADDVERAMESVWPPTRRQLETAYDELDDHFDGDPPIERTDMLVVTRMESPMLISRMRTDGATPEAPSDGEELAVLVEFRDDRSTDVPLRWSGDDGRWYVDLPIDERRPLQLIDEADADDGEVGEDTTGAPSAPGERKPNDVEEGTNSDD